MSWRFYSDLSVISVGGQYRFEARSPENGTIPNREGSLPEVKPDYLQFSQSGFRYQLIDQSSEKVVWERWELASHPTGLFVSEDGWSVIFSDSIFQTFTPECRLTCTVRICPAHYREDVITSNNDKYNRPGYGYVYSEYVQLTTAGAIWETASLKYFVECHGRPHFVCRAGWGDRIVVDMENGVLGESDDVTSNICIESEKRITQTYIESVADEIRKTSEKAWLDEDTIVPREQWPDLKGVIAATIWLSGSDVAEDDLSTILCLSEIGVTSTLGGLRGRWTVFTMEYRTLIKLALRIRGCLPCEMGSYGFGHYIHDVSGVSPEEFSLIDMPNPVDVRDELLTEIALDMSIDEVVKTIGALDDNGSYLVSVCDKTFK